jgi:hypothetical protein
MAPLKQCITHESALGSGLNLYLHDDDPSCPANLGRQLGVMVDDAAGVLPQASTLSPVGFKTADYSSINIQPADFITSLTC